MDHVSVYQLSERYAPPGVDLRFASVLDDWGDDSHSTYPINHKHPDDVTRADLDAYPQKWAFMDLSDMLFYLYPLAKEFAADPKPMSDCVWSYLFCLNRSLQDAFEALDTFEQEAVREGLQWLDDSNPYPNDPVIEFRKLRRILGLRPLENPLEDME